MAKQILTEAQLEALKKYDAPTISNALELLGFREQDRNAGIMASRIRPIFPHLPPMVGYAATFLCETSQPPRGKLQVSREEYWRYVLSVPEPRVSVGQDIGPTPAAGSVWGEIQANIHVALGCQGLVIEGAVRDLTPLEALAYPCFAREVTVGHSYAHFVDFGQTVRVGDVLVHSGDLIFADLHGVLVIPHEAAPLIEAACRRIVDIERPLLAVCKDRANFSLERLIAAYNTFKQEYPEARPQKED